MGSTPLIDERQEVELARELQDAREGIAKVGRRVPAAARQQMRVPLVSGGVAWAQLDGSPELALGRGPVPLVVQEDGAEGGVGLAE